MKTRCDIGHCRLLDAKRHTFQNSVKIVNRFGQNGSFGKLIDDAVNRREAYVKQYEKTLLIADNEILILKTQMKANTDGFEEEY